MVYYGVVSKGCERCRQRRIKCDERKPGCFRCEKVKKKCPGYRDLVDVLFRDESNRIIRKAQGHAPPKKKQRDSSIHKTGFDSSAATLTPVNSNISYSLSPSLHELAANLFFARYIVNGPPVSECCRSWLAQIYLGDQSSYGLRSAIHAVGMAGLSNIFYAPHIAPVAREQYSQALLATNRALKDPIEVASDTTLMLVFLLGFFETITFNSWHQYRSWVAHVKGATALLQLRGGEQFNSELGVQLYIQLRSQIACMLQGIVVPLALMETSRMFEACVIREYQDHTRAASIADMSFHLANLRAAIKSHEMTDPNTIYQAAIGIDRELIAWKADLHPSWNKSAAPQHCTNKVDFSTSSLGVNQDAENKTLNAQIQVWNNWRILRILTHQIILSHCSGTVSNASLIEIGQSDKSSSVHTPDTINPSTSLSLIQQLSADICNSTAALTSSPRAAALIWPLFIVSQEHSNTCSIRSLAMQHLRFINTWMGIRQAGLLADTVLQGLERVVEFTEHHSLP